MSIYKKKVNNVETMRNIEYTMSNNLGIYMNQTVLGENTAPYHGLFIKQEENKDEVYLSKMMEQIKIDGNIYSISDISTNEEKYGGVEYLEDLSINDLYYAILTLALEELQEEINRYIKNNYSEQEKDIFEKLKQIDCTDTEQWDIWCNCLDTHISFIGDQELAEVLSAHLQYNIDKISDKIGFTYINLNI